MIQYNSYNNYDLDPMVYVSGYGGAVMAGNEKISASVKDKIEKGAKTIAFDLYPGVDKNRVMELARALEPDRIIETDTCKLSEDELENKFGRNITDDRVFGVISACTLEECFDSEKIESCRKEISASDALTIIVGVGATLLATPDVHYYFDITRWEIQLRFRRGATNWMFKNPDQPLLTKYKIGFFVEWRLADRYKTANLRNIDYWIDANRHDELRMISSDAFLAGFMQATKKPVRMQAYYDPSVWGGYWMKNMFNLPENGSNYGWSFDGVPEENSFKLDFDGEWIEFPAIDLVFLYPEQLLGKRVYGRFGAEFPIRFDMLDTMDGGNLSLQVHPLTSYIQQKFGMHYTQDESYYILDSTDESCVYLGVKKDVVPQEMKKDLEAANKGQIQFPDEKYINCFPVKKHDHVLIPAGTTHCSGKNTMVLEISATPYIFTFKMWDWGRIGLDGLPRPVHIEHGMNNIQFNRDTDWVQENLLHQEKVIYQDKDILVEHTGLHAFEYLETVRYSLKKPIACETDDSVIMLNLVDGKEAWIKSPTDAFEPVKIHYAETFIIPCDVDKFILAPAVDGTEVKFITAHVR